MVENSQRADVFTLTGGFRLEPRCVRQKIIAALKICFRRTAPELVIQAQSFSPIRHGAAGILFGDFLELVFRHFIFKRVHQGHAAFKRLLHSGGTGSGERHASYFFIGTEMMMAFVREQGRGQAHECKERK